MKRVIVLIYILLLFSFLNSCNNIEERMDKRFNLVELHRDLGFMDEMDLLSDNQLMILRAFINEKIMNDSLKWLEKHTYRELYGYAANYSFKSDGFSERMLADKMQQKIFLKMDGAYTDSSFFSFTLSNLTGKPVRSVLAEVILYDELNNELGRLKLKQIDSIGAGNSIRIKNDNSLLFTYSEAKNPSYKSIIKRVLFYDGEQWINSMDD